ncbi:MAG: MarR family transcriptional regulator [Polyangiaceae bacterium]
MKIVEQRREHELPLGESLEFLRRIWRLDHALERLSRRMEAELGVTGQQRLILRCVGKYPGVTAGQLAQLLHVDPGTMSTALRRLERRSLIRRRRDPTDKRRLSLGLTEHGRVVDAPSARTLEAAVDELLDTTTPEEKASGVAVIERLVAIIEGIIGEEGKAAHAEYMEVKPIRAKRR